MGAPVRHTCPNIDKAIKKVKIGLSYLLDAKKCEDIDDMKEAVDYAVYEIEDIDEYFEDLRSDNDQLRNWGHELEEKLKELELIIDDLQDQLLNN